MRRLAPVGWLVGGLICVGLALATGVAARSARAQGAAASGDNGARSAGGGAGSADNGAGDADNGAGSAGGGADTGAGSIAELRRLFTSPPDDSRIMVRWWWFGPAVTGPELEREMRVMKDGGIGGFEVQPVYPLTLDDAARGIKNLPFLSDAFLDALRFTADKANELGLRMDLTLGSGWPYGGPQIPIDLAAGRLRYEHVALTTGMRRVPLPSIGAGERLLAVFVGAGSAGGDTRGRGGTGSGSSDTGGSGGAGSGGGGSGGTGGSGSGGRGSRAAEENFDSASLRELTVTDADVRDGGMTLPAGVATGAQQQLLFFIASRTGMMVKRPAIGAEGFVLDHYDRAAIDRYLDTVGVPLLHALDARPPYAIFCDSLEVYQSDWTGDLLEQFQRRRGYDLKPHLPALVANVGPATASIRRDWGRTLTELFDERFVTPLHEFAKQHHTRLRMQGYGVPPATVSSNALADLPEGEGWQWKQLQATRWASSASHLYGRPVTSSETWTWLHSPVFRATPLDVKAEADLHFLQGINQLIGHGWPYTAEGVEPPGWRFYAAGVWNEKNPWWIAIPDLARYLQRVSTILRQGEPANDVALYLPNDDAWARITGGRANLLDGLRERLGPDVIGAILEGGFNLDLFDDAALDALKLGHRIVVLPSVETIPLDTLRKLDAFARAGGIVIATRRVPDRAPGFRATEQEHREVRELSARLFEGAGAPGHLVRDEKADLPRTLATLLPPDVAVAPAAPDVGFVHRHTSNAEIYFIANTSNTRQRVAVSLRSPHASDAPHSAAAPHAAVTPKAAAAPKAGAATNAALAPNGSAAAEVWNAVDGTMVAADAHRTSDQRLAVSLDLDAYASRFIVVPHNTGAVVAGGAPHALTGREPTGRQQTGRHTIASPPIDISGGWVVTFGSHGQPTQMDHLRSWTDDDSTRDFSGVATYERTVHVPPGLLRSDVRIALDFGEAQPTGPRDPNARMQAWLDAPVREAAVVFVNDRRVGSVWCPPYALDVTAALKAGDNRLRIQVGNLAINNMSAHALPDYRLLNLRYGVRFEPQDMDKVRPVNAGLLGPIRLIPSRKQ